MSFPRYPKYKDSGAEWLGEVPEHWETIALKRLVSLKSGDGIIAERINEVGDYPVFGGNGLRGFTSGYTHDGHFVIIGRQGALCGNINYGSGKFWASEHAVVASPLKLVDTVWLGEMLRAMDLNQYSVSAAQPGLSMDFVGCLQTALPPLPEQIAIATFLDRETAKIDALVEEQRRLIELLKEKRQAVISHAVTKGLNPDVPMKPSGIDWLGDVPAHWEVAGLTKYLFPVVDYRGRTPTKVDEGVFLLTARNIRNGRIDYTVSQEFIAAEEYGRLMSRGRPQIGDVVFTTEAPLGQVANIDREDVAIAQRVIKFRGKPDRVNNYFLKYWIMGSYCQSDFEQLATGSTALGIKGSKVGQVKICLPPLGEQSLIVEFLEDLNMRFDSLTAEAERAIELLQERRTALISAAVTGKIDVRGLAAQAEAA